MIKIPITIPKCVSEFAEKNGGFFRHQYADIIPKNPWVSQAALCRKKTTVFFGSLFLAACHGDRGRAAIFVYILFVVWRHQRLLSFLMNLTCLVLFLYYNSPQGLFSNCLD